VGLSRIGAVPGRSRLRRHCQQKAKSLANPIHCRQIIAAKFKSKAQLADELGAPSHHRCCQKRNTHAASQVRGLQPKQGQLRFAY
jgi:hypothetical protein